MGQPHRAAPDSRPGSLRDCTALPNIPQPKQENFHVIYTDEKGRILAHNMLSSGTLNSVNMGIAWLLSDVKSTAARLGLPRRISCTTTRAATQDELW